MLAAVATEMEAEEGRPHGEFTSLGSQLMLHDGVRVIGVLDGCVEPL